MKHFLRLVSATVTVGAAVLSPAAFAASGGSVAELPVLLNDWPAFIASSNSVSGYLGIGFRDVDAERASSLKLKEASGVEILTVDHDAPAGAVGLRTHDVVLQMNGQAIANADHLRRMLHETPPGRTVSLVISRDGQQQTLSVELADQSELEKKAMDGLTTFNDPDGETPPVSLQPPAAHSGIVKGFFASLPFGTPSVGVQLDTLGSQLADYFGVRDGQGLLIKRVAANSPAYAAGLKAGDVVTKVNGRTMATLGEWEKALHSNRGKDVQVTIFRNRREQTVTMQDGDPKHKG